jgi:CheY-like chemotaxis protein
VEKQSNTDGVGTEGSGQESQPASGWPPSSAKAGDASGTATRFALDGRKSSMGRAFFLWLTTRIWATGLLKNSDTSAVPWPWPRVERMGLQLVRSGLVDVVISEMGLPDLPGMDLLRELHGLPKMPKVILTTNRHSDFLADAGD